MVDAERRRRWEEVVLAKFLEQRGERKTTFETWGGDAVDRLAIPGEGPEDLPGEYPFTRGIQPTMYRGKLWTMRQYSGFSTAKETNRRFQYLLDQGQNGLSVAFDLPTQIGYDSDDPLSSGEVGKVGVAIDTLADYEILMDGIDLGSVSTSMTINSTAAVLLAMHVAVAEKQGVSLEQLRGTVQNDILKEYIARGTQRFPPRQSMRLITDMFEWCSENLPSWNPISISGYHIREAGSSAAQELGFTFANAVAYVDAAVERGLDLNKFANRLTFFFNSHNDFLEEVAKFRAARRLWARLLSERYEVTNPRVLKLKFHTQTAGSTLTAEQPENNVARVTIQALAAVLGGTQSLHTNSMDEALALPSDKAALIALRTQQIVAHESGIPFTVDPLGGSYFVEQKTAELEREAMKIITRIDELGGTVAAIEQDFQSNEIHEAAFQVARRMEQGQIQVVGVNCFEDDDQGAIDLLRVDEVVERDQQAALQNRRQIRDEAEVASALDEIEEGAGVEKNVFPHILRAVKVYASVGEICARLAGIWGEYQ